MHDTTDIHGFPLPSVAAHHLYLWLSLRNPTPSGDRPYCPARPTTTTITLQRDNRDEKKKATDQWFLLRDICNPKDSFNKSYHQVHERTQNLKTPRALFHARHVITNQHPTE